MDAHKYTKQQQIELGFIPENPDETLAQRNFIKANLWEKAIVPYEIKTSDFTSSEITIIQNAIKEMNDKTCLRIEPRSESLAAEAGHNSYVQVFSGRGCYSYVGRVSYYAQGLSLQRPDCVTNAITIHEFGHAIGMMHEQSRADRDNYVRINWDNVSEEKKDNMAKFNTIDNNPYDLESVLQYGLYAFSKNGQKTIDVLDSRLEFLADTASGLEFYDAQDIIDAYGCAANCLNVACQHHGYVDHQCKCVCPRGVTGTNCETLITENTCGGDIVLSPDDSQVITSPNYPNSYNQNEQCVWYIRATSGQNVLLDIDELDLSGSRNLCYHWLEVQYNLIGQTGPRSCGTVSNVSYITSNDQKTDMMLIFDTKFNSKTATRKGFSLRVSSTGPGCTSNPCKFGSCNSTNNQGGFQCTCDAEYTGFLCDTLINDVTLTCGFESNEGYCFLEDSFNGMFNWTVNTGLTPSPGTGPTGAASGSNYLYAEASSPQKPGDMAKLQTSAKLPATAKCLEFKYNMNGHNMGTLKVKYSGDSFAETTLWTKSGNQENVWLKQKVDIPATLGLQVFIEAVVGSSELSDIALDDLKISTGACVFYPCDSSPCLNGGTCTSSGSSFTCSCLDWYTGTNCENAVTGTNLTCTGEDSENCFFVQDKSTDTWDWERKSGSTPTYATGPSSAFEGSYYYYFETSGPVRTGDTAIFVSSAHLLDFQYCLRFNYHMHGNSMGTLRVESASASNSATTIFTKSSNQGNTWNSAEVNFSGNGNKVQFVGLKGSSYKSDIAIDNIVLSPGLCDPGVNPCETNLCKNGATCTVSGSTIICICATGYTGDACDTEVLPCDSIFCQNGGTCTNVESSSYTCNCANLFTGTNCETQLPSCTSSPCNNGGTCTDLSSTTFRCQCASGYTGPTCDVQILPCDSDPCQNRGTCTNVGATSFTCKCANIFTGTNCETIIRPCTSSPCNNGGTCTDLTFTTFSCHCALGFFGQTCDKQVALPCDTKPCLNGGTCTNVDLSSFTCQCSSDFDGNTCADEISSWACTFEDGFGGDCFLIQEESLDTMNWTINEGHTPSSDTGPSSAYEGVKYAYLKASEPAESGDYAVMKSTQTFSDNISYCLNFRYFIHGNRRKMGRLVVYNTASDNDILWSKSGSREQWRKAKITFPPTTTMQVRIGAFGGQTGKADIAVDDIQFTNRPCYKYEAERYVDYTV